MIDILGERAYNISTRIGGDYMLDVNMIIANNIQDELKKENKKQVDLAEGIGVSRQTMSKIMNRVVQAFSNSPLSILPCNQPLPMPDNVPKSNP